MNLLKMTSSCCAFTLLLSLSCKSHSTNSSGVSSEYEIAATDLKQLQLDVLEAETPRVVSIEEIASRSGYTGFPSTVFARKGGVLTDEDRKLEKTPPRNNDSAAHRFLIDVGQQMYQQALLAYLSRDPVYFDNARALLAALVQSKLRFINDPKDPTETNDNRMLESAWFVTLVARAARIIDLKADAAWKQKNQWEMFKSQLNAYLGWNFDQTRFTVTPDYSAAKVAEAYEKATLIELASSSGLMNWVAQVPENSKTGSTNRTFAALEALFRLAEFRGGKIGYAKWAATHWSDKDKLPRESEGQMSDLFLNFRYYQRQHFITPNGQNTGDLIIKSDPQRTTIAGELNREPCKDPAATGYKADCLVNKDAYRNDNYHPQMGLASVMNLIQIGKRNGLELTPDEHEMVKQGLRWACYYNYPGIVSPGANGSFGIHTWELAYRFYGKEALGPYCQMILDKNRSKPQLQKASFGWGFDLINEDL